MMLTELSSLAKQ